MIMIMTTIIAMSYDECLVTFSKTMQYNSVVVLTYVGKADAPTSLVSVLRHLTDIEIAEKVLKYWFRV